MTNLPGPKNYVRLYIFIAVENHAQTAVLSIKCSHIKFVVFLRQKLQALSQLRICKPSVLIPLSCAMC